MNTSIGKMRIGAIAIVAVTATALATMLAMRAPRAIAASQTPRAIAAVKQPSPAPAARNDPPHISYEKIPMSFEPNLGQSNPQVSFLSRGNGYTLFLTPAEAVIAMRQSAPDGARDGHPAKPGQLAHEGHLLPAAAAGNFSRAGREEEKSAVVRIALKGAAPSPQISGVDRLPGKSNYFIGNDPKKWHTDVPNYAKVELKDVYPGIDLIYHGSEQSQLEYDFRLAPDANPDAIRLSFEGGKKLAIDKRGNLVVNIGDQKLIEHAPVIYQESGGNRRMVAGGWRLHGAHEAGFRVASYDRSRPVVIDPVLVYSTYLGGSGVCDAWGISGYCQGDSGGVFHVDSSGNVYVTGTTYSTDFPTMPGALQTINNAAGNHTSNVFITKLNADGSGLIYSTYLGGSGVCDTAPKLCRGDIGGGAYVDSSGDIYVSGWTYSIDFPTLHAFQTTNRAAGIGGLNMFITKLNSAGSGLIYSTYLGSSGGEEGFLSYVDSSGSAYVSGDTGATDFPITAGAFQSALVSSSISNFNPEGWTGDGSTVLFDTTLCPVLAGTVTLQYTISGTTYVGTDDGSGNITGPDLTGTIDYQSGAVSLLFDSPPDSGTQITVSYSHYAPSNVFVTKLNAEGSGLVYSTYLGGSGVCAVDGFSSSGDYGGVYDVDSSGNSYVWGTTYSADFPTTPGAFQPTNHAAVNQTSNAFVTKLNAEGSGLVYSTYLGGSGVCDVDGISGDCQGDLGIGEIVVDSSGNAYVSGDAYSTDFPTTPGAYQTTNNAAANNTSNAFVTKLNTDGSGLVYSTYLGGSGVCDVDGVSANCQGDLGFLSYVDPLRQRLRVGRGLFDRLSHNPRRVPDHESCSWRRREPFRNEAERHRLRAGLLDLPGRQRRLRRGRHFWRLPGRPWLSLLRRSLRQRLRVGIGLFDRLPNHRRCVSNHQQCRWHRRLQRLRDEAKRRRFGAALLDLPGRQRRLRRGRRQRLFRRRGFHLLC